MRSAVSCAFSASPSEAVSERSLSSSSREARLLVDVRDMVSAPFCGVDAREAREPGLFGVEARDAREPGRDAMVSGTPVTNSIRRTGAGLDYGSIGLPPAS